MKQRAPSIKLYIEGGNRDSKLDQSLCRQAFQKFFDAAGIKRKPATIACGGRSQAFDRFKTAFCHHNNDKTRCLLLVDSESDFNFGESKWNHLKNHDQEHPEKPEGADETHIYFMVQIMETWLLADLEALKNVFGKNFDKSQITKWFKLETVPKEKIYEVLKKSCSGRYEKGNKSFEVFAELNPSTVEAACPSAKELLDHLRTFN